MSSFWDKVNKTDTCWLWTGSIQYKYGRIKIKQKTYKAHRVSYELVKGPIPRGIIVCHTCDNPPCVNPSHLFLGTHKVNSQDMVDKGRSLKGTKHHQCKLSDNEVLEIRRLRETTNLSLPRITAQYNVSFGHIWKLVKGWNRNDIKT